MAADDEEDDDVSISELQLHSNDIPTSPVPESLLLEDDEDDMPGKWFFKLEVLMKRKLSFSYLNENYSNLNFLWDFFNEVSWDFAHITFVKP